MSREQATRHDNMAREIPKKYDTRNKFSPTLHADKRK
jgi:hypothetical protein